MQGVVSTAGGPWSLSGMWSLDSRTGMEFGGSKVGS